MRLILAGASRRGDSLIQQMTSNGDAQVVAIADPVVAKAQLVRSRNRIPDCAIFDSLPKALVSTPCDAVVVASPDANHAELVLPSLAAGKYVFCEKPLETTARRCRDIIEADRAAGGRTFVGLNLRYAPVYEAIKSLVDAGAVGRMLSIQADEFYNGGRSYFRRWNRLPSQGGLWLSKATHDFDLLQWFAGAPAQQLAAVGARTHYAPRKDAPTQCRNCTLADCPDRAPSPDDFARVHEAATGSPHDLCLYNSDGDTFDHGVATVQFANQVLATYTCNLVSGFTDRRIRVSGSKGTIDGSLNGDALILRRRDPSALEEIPVVVTQGVHGGADLALARAFVDFARGSGTPRCRPMEAAISVCMGLAATRSMQEGRFVSVPEIEGEAGVAR